MDNMSTINDTLSTYLQDIPEKFRARIINEYTKIKLRYRKADFDASGLSCGKFCEECLRFLQHYLTGVHTGFRDELKNFHLEVAKLEKVDKSTGNDSLRIIIPRALAFLYTLRNKRNIGHSGGDVEANQIDSLTINRVSDWIMCELIRIFHKKSLEEAQQIIDLISSRNIPDVWEVNGKKRVLLSNLSAKEKTLLLCYSHNEQGVFFEELIEWIEYRNTSDFRSKVLKPLHKEGLIEFDTELNLILLSPKGDKEVEDRILQNRN
ncbi:MAG: hypothetical protein JSS82_20655 [Bacteroidetes bacterium]|nr:hypothetical protein [Bacteroidota bacterium]